MHVFLCHSLVNIRNLLLSRPWEFQIAYIFFFLYTLQLLNEIYEKFSSNSIPPIGYQIRFHSLTVFRKIQPFHNVHYSEPYELRNDTRIYSDNNNHWYSADHYDFLCLLQMRIFSSCNRKIKKFTTYLRRVGVTKRTVQHTPRLHRGRRVRRRYVRLSKYTI